MDENFCFSFETGNKKKFLDALHQQRNFLFFFGIKQHLLVFLNNKRTKEKREKSFARFFKTQTDTNTTRALSKLCCKALYIKKILYPLFLRLLSTRAVNFISYFLNFPTFALFLQLFFALSCRFFSAFCLP